MGQMVMELEQPQLRAAPGVGIMPGWVPRSVQNYIDHTEMGVPIRALARRQGCHASTILRQIRRVETLRDDPLVDGVLTTLGGTPEREVAAADTLGKTRMIGVAGNTTHILPDLAQLCAHGLRVLRRLCETGAVLAVAADMEKAVIVRDGTDGENTRTGVVDRTIAEAMALKGWISAPDGGRVSRYQITAAGRSALADMMARDESALAGASFESAQKDAPRRIRYGLAESPLAALARRRDRDGERFLEVGLVHAGERLREDFEMAQMGADVARNWENFLAAVRSDTAPVHTGGTRATGMAHARVITALQELGPGLSDVTLRCCCFLEGLETAEKMLGWSARSGKIVLRIALMRLKEHYARTAGTGGAMIG
jgi:DNA-binding PadR family transcriptional regulator